LLSGGILAVKYVMPLTPELEAMLQVAQDPSASAQKLRGIYTYLTEAINRPGRMQIVNAIMANPNTPIEVLFEFRHCGYILENPAFPLIVLEEPQFLNQDILMVLLTHANAIHPNNISLLTENPHEEIREEVSLHVSITGEANENWRDEAGVILAQGCWPCTERDLLENTYRIPEWVSMHFPQESVGNDMKSLERLRIFCYALQYGSGWETNPWYFHLGRLLSSRMYPSDYRTYGSVGNRFVRAAARELLEKRKLKLYQHAENTDN
jgi:hypothetical protein